MNREDFNDHVDRVFQGCKDILCTKGEDYSYADEDRLSNFKETAKEIGQSPFTIWYVYFNKGLSSIRRYINKGKVESENIHARIKDAINYLILLDAMITEKEAIASIYIDANSKFNENQKEALEDFTSPLAPPTQLKVQVGTKYWVAYIGRAVYHYPHPNDDPTHRVPAIIVAIDDYRRCVELKYAQSNSFYPGVKLTMLEPINAEAIDETQDKETPQEENRSTSI